MGWIQSHLRKQNEGSGLEGVEAEFGEAARTRWVQLGEELDADVNEFNAHQSGGAFERDGDAA